MAIREDGVAAEAMGINLLKHKEISFIISSFFTAVAGGLLAMFMRSIEARTFQITLTYDILLIVVIGASAVSPAASFRHSWLPRPRNGGCASLTPRWRSAV